MEDLTTGCHRENRRPHRLSLFTYNDPIMRASSLIRLVGAAAAAIPCLAPAQARARQPAVPATSTVLVPDRVWDGVEDAPHSGWAVLVTGNKIIAAGPRSQISVPAGATTINLPGTTLMPGLIDAHSHVLLHPYNETSWNDQVLHVRMRIDQSRHQRRAREIDRRRAGGRADLTARAGGDDLVAGDEYRPAGMRCRLHAVPDAVGNEERSRCWNGGLATARRLCRS